MKKSNTILCTVLGLFAVQAHADGDILVRYKNSIPHVSVMSNAAATIQSVLGRAAVVSMRQMVTDPTVHVVSIDAAADISKAVAALKRNPDVEVAEENFDIELYDQPAGVAVPNDAEFSKQWGMLNVGQKIGGGWTGAEPGVAGSDINVSPLWAAGITGSRDIIVAVIDTGVDKTHPDLKDNIYVNPGEIPGNGIDDDHNGFIDDVSGWNFVNNSNAMIDDHSHGTHCAGVIGANGNDGKGVAGVSWKVRILPVKIFDGKGGGKLEVAVNAINYATMMGARVMSNSWGWKGTGKEKSRDRISINSSSSDDGEDIAKVSTLMRDAIKKAGEKGALFVAAAGNSRADNDSTPHFPSSYKLDNIVSVAALDNHDRLASFSCYGKNSVHVGAPGVDIYSTVPGGKFEMMSGTSMATPHVSGIAALALSHNPSLTYQELKARMISTSTPIPALAGKFQAGGRINAEKVVRGL